MRKLLVALFFMIAISAAAFAAVILGVSRIVQIICPPVYSNKYNDKLQQALNYNKLAFNFTPSIDFDGNASITMAVSYKY
jgi:hypothetical protein